MSPLGGAGSTVSATSATTGVYGYDNTSPHAGSSSSFGSDNRTGAGEDPEFKESLHVSRFYPKGT